MTGRKIELTICSAATNQCAVVGHGETLALLMKKNPQAKVVVLGDTETVNIPKICGDNVRISPLPTNQEELFSVVERNLSTLEFQSGIDETAFREKFSRRVLSSDIREHYFRAFRWFDAKSRAS